jgi:hypothetical protein
MSETNSIHTTVTHFSNTQKTVRFFGYFTTLYQL